VADDNQKTRAQFLTDSVAIAGASALAYLVSFLFEQGYSDHFGIPATLISPSLTTVLVCAAAIGGILFWFVVMSPLYSHFFVASEVAALAPYRLLLRLLAVLVALVILVIATFGWQWPLILTLVAGALLPFLLSFLAVALGERKVPMRDRFAKHAEAQERDTGYALIDGLMRKLGTTGRWLAIFATVVLFVAYGAGHATATRQVDFPMLKSDPSLALLRTYGSLMIAVRVDRTARSATNELVVSWLDEKKTVEFKIEPIGPLGRATALPRAASAAVAGPVAPSSARAASGP
jgi:hypothetical protein